MLASQTPTTSHSRPPTTCSPPAVVGDQPEPASPRVWADSRFGRLRAKVALGLLLALTPAVAIQAEDWRQFRGPGGTASGGTQDLPVQWSATSNLAWQADLPGPGSSSPILVGERIFVTSYTGYGLSKDEPGTDSKLSRQVVCLDRATGKIGWTREFANQVREDDYRGYLTEHGYASSTPTSDGTRVYAFLGKSGVVALDLDGKVLWQVEVGQESSNRRWGSAASLVVSSQSLFVNASEESQTVYALDPETGKQQWKATGSALELAYGTPALVELGDGRTDLVLAAPGEIWGLNAQTGKLRWFAEHTLTGNVCPSVVVHEKTAFVFGGFGSAGSFAVTLGGEGELGAKAKPWTSRTSSYVATPVYHEGRLYWVDDRGQAHCCDANTGELVYRERVPDLDTGGRPVYASPVVSAGRLYVPTRWNGVLVVAAGTRYEELARNRFADDDSEFNATPAIADGALYLRSNKRLYRVQASGQ